MKMSSFSPAEGAKYFPAAALFFTLSFLLCFAAKDIGLSWDETSYFRYSEGLIGWAKMGMPLGHDSLRLVWDTGSYLNPHPPFLNVLSAFFAYFFDWLPFVLSFRIGHILFTSACLTTAFSLLLPEFGLLRSLAAIGFVFLQPRLFTEFLIGTLDGPVALGWLLLPLLAWKISLRGSRQQKSIYWVLFFLIHAAVAATKITGFIAVAPVIVFLLYKRDFRGLFLAAASCLAALAFVALLAPDQWGSPLTTIASYLSYPFHRGSSVKIAVFYLWKVYREGTLPLHYFFLMTAVTMPPLSLALVFCSPLAWRNETTKGLALALLPAVAIWICMGLWQSVPKHDGVRQFTAFLALLGMCSWLGLLGLLEILPKAFLGVRGKCRDAAVTAVPLAGAFLALMGSHPYELSYYSELFGGLKSAEAHGLEITYLLEAINPTTLDWINANLPRNATLAILPMWSTLLEVYQEHGLLRADLRILGNFQEQSADFLLLLRRRSLVKDEIYAAQPPLYEVEHQGVSILRVVRGR
jgi:hypothetical protein